MGLEYDDSEHQEEDFGIAFLEDGQPGGYDVFSRLNLSQDVYYIWALCADFHLYIYSPYFDPIYPPKKIESLKEEWVYPIWDYGDRFSVSVPDGLFSGSRATGRYLNTIEKILYLTIERAKSSPYWEEEGSGEGEHGPEIRVAFSGHEIGLRKGFHYCLLSQENILVTNFEPGEWGDRQLRVMDYLVEKGYFPPKGYSPG